MNQCMQLECRSAVASYAELRRTLGGCFKDQTLETLLRDRVERIQIMWAYVVFFQHCSAASPAGLTCRGRLSVYTDQVRLFVYTLTRSDCLTLTHARLFYTDQVRLCIHLPGQTVFHWPGQTVLY